MSTLEYTISMLETLPEEKIREVQKYIQYLIFKDMDDTAPADIVSQRMKEKYAI